MRLISNVIPSMISRADIDLFKGQIAGLGQGAPRIVEFGPWLGAVSVELARLGKLHVVENFLWTNEHAKREPGLLEPGDSFRPLFEAALARESLSAEIYDTSFDSLHWHSGELDVFVLDAPKSAIELRNCLAPVLASLRIGGKVLLKHGLDPIYPEMTAWIERLVALGYIVPCAQQPHPGCSVLILERGNQPDLSKLAAIPINKLVVDGSLLAALDLPDNHPFRFVKMVGAVQQHDWPAVFDSLSAMKPASEIVGSWDKIEPKLARFKADPEQMTALAEVVSAHHAAIKAESGPVSFHASPAHAWRGYWLNRQGIEDRGKFFHPEVLRKAYEFGYLGWPSKIREHVAGKDVLDIRCGPGLHGIGYIAAGARSYLGLDPIVKLDRDRVKNLNARDKQAFGWSPNQLSALLGPWQVSPTRLQEIAPLPQFDIAILHNVTEHLHAIEDIFEQAEQRLRPGGKLLFNHHNFYSWNGHHLPPKTIDEINLADPVQLQMIDWGHVEYEPDDEHYIARGLNRIRIDQILDLTRRHFDIEFAEEIPSRPNTGSQRLTDIIRERYTDLTDRDFLTQSLYCIARVRR